MLVSLGASASVSPFKTSTVCFASFKLHCASLMFSINRPDFDDRLRLFLVQCNCQNGSCRCFHPTFPRYLQRRRAGRPPRTKNHGVHILTVCVIQSDRACSSLLYESMDPTGSSTLSLETRQSFRIGLM